MSLMDILNEGKLAGARLMEGAFIGIVTNNQDPDGMGRVKVKYPWRENQDESYWARIATLMAGKDRGSFFLPEVGDEVLLIFGHGDIHNPFIIGSLWNGQDKPPESNANGKNNIRKIKSRSGHEIILDDTDQAGKVEILSQAGHQIIMDDSKGGEKIEIKDKTGSNSVVIDSNRNSISIQSTTQLKIKASSIEIEADAAMTIKAGATLTIKGTLVQIN